MPKNVFSHLKCQKIISPKMAMTKIFCFIPLWDVRPCIHVQWAGKRTVSTGHFSPGHFPPGQIPPGEYFSPVLSRIYSLLDNFPTTIIISINAYIRMCIHVHTYSHTWIHTYIIYAHTYMHTNYTCIYARVLCMYVRTFAYVYYKHPYMHICIHMHT